MNKRITRNTPKTNCEYTITQTRVLYKLSWSILFISLPLILRFVLGPSYTMLIFFQLLCIIIAIPAIIISINHWKYNGKVKLIFKQGLDEFTVFNKSKKYVFDVKNINEIMRRKTLSSFAPWNVYEYSIIKFNDNSELWVSNLLIKTDVLDSYLQTPQINESKPLFPLMRKTVHNNT
mgnify:CR=1 FL=1